MKKKFVIFYSWQSDVPDTKKLITKCLDKAVKRLSKELGKEFLEIEVDRDTKGKSGTPDITDSIIEKIEASDIFVGDVTIINAELARAGKTKASPNPNVLFELGYAVKTLGWERVICLNDNTINKVEELPFDIRSRRVSGFDNRDEEKLISLLIIALKSIVENYEKILERIIDSKKKAHDKMVYSKTNEILSESRLKDTLEWITSSLYITDLQYSYWEELNEFYNETLNHFIDEESHRLFTVYLKELDAFKWICYRYLKVRQVHGETLYQAKQEGKEITEEVRFQLLQNVGYSSHKEPYQGETWVESDRRILENQREMSTQVDRVYEAYSEFIKSYKTNTLI